MAVGVSVVECTPRKAPGLVVADRILCLPTSSQSATGSGTYARTRLVRSYRCPSRFRRRPAERSFRPFRRPAPHQWDAPYQRFVVRGVRDGTGEVEAGKSTTMNLGAHVERLGQVCDPKVTGDPALEVRAGSDEIWAAEGSVVSAVVTCSRPTDKMACLPR